MLDKDQKVQDLANIKQIQWGGQLKSNKNT